MKITKTQLKQIIKEEMTIMNESLVEHNSDNCEDDYEEEKYSDLFKKGFWDGITGLSPHFDDNLEYMQGHLKGVRYMWNDGKLELAKHELE